MGNSVFHKFSQWLDKLLENNNFDNILAFNFNLYEYSNEDHTCSSYHIQLIGSDEFDAKDSDWACSEIFTSGEDIFENRLQNCRKRMVRGIGLLYQNCNRVFGKGEK